MRNPPPSLLPLLRSQVQGNLLALTYLNPDREFSLTEAAGRIGASVKAVQQEAVRLIKSGILTDRRIGHVRLIRSVTESPLTRPLTDLLALTYGPLPILTGALSGIAGVERAFIYGSWAARYNGEAGPPPVDVDVLVVGTVDPDILEDAAREAQKRLGREVNIRRLRPQTWNTPDDADPFLASVRSRPIVELELADPIHPRE